MRQPVECVLVNHARIGPLAGIIRHADGLLMEWEDNGRGVIVTDTRQGNTWLIPWTNIASVKLGEPQVPAAIVPHGPLRNKAGRPKKVEQVHILATANNTVAHPCDKRSLAPLLGLK
jgi:hypothetical protein